MPSKPPKYVEVDGAPYISIDIILSAGFVNGLIQVNVGAQDLRHDQAGKIEAVSVPSGHLRLTPWAAKEMLKAVQQALEMVETKAALPSVSRQ